MTQAKPLLSAFTYGTDLAVRIHAVPLERTGPTPPGEDAIHLAFLLDRSGSMSGERLTAVKRTLHAARPLFDPEDRVTLITFSNSAMTVVADHVMDESGALAFYTAVDELEANGGTNLSAAFEALGSLRLSLDAIILLTDGQVNEGISSTQGLLSLGLGLGSKPFYTLGYGSDHNRSLLKALALKSRGSYIHVDDESMLPRTLGDLMGGLRTQVFASASLSVEGATCRELGGGSSTFRVGAIVPDRDYWVIFTGAPSSVFLREGTEVIDTALPLASADEEVREQILRSQVAEVLEDATTALENYEPVPASLAALCALIDALPDTMRGRDLVNQMRAELEVIRTAPPRPSAELLARMSSGTAYLSSQRGVSVAFHDTFSSPMQRQRSEETQILYASQRSEDPV
jgi:hypothetical protein